MVVPGGGGLTAFMALGSPGSEVADFFRVLQPVVEEDNVRRLRKV